MKKMILSAAVFLAAGIAVYFLGERAGERKYHHISGFAWSAEEWAERTRGIRTSYNPDHDLSTTQLTLVPGDERWLDFVFWCFDNKVAEHQVEAYGGTEWKGPVGGIIFHWAPGSRWETHTLASFGSTIGHTIGEHKWMDTQFPDFFEKYGGVYGVNVKDRLAEIDPASPKPWVEFLEYIGGAKSPHYRYLFHQEAVIDPVAEKIYLTGGQGVGFEYSFERYYHELKEVLTDAKAFQFFQLYDLYGPGFASMGGWAKNRMAAPLKEIYYADTFDKWSSKPGKAKPVRYDPNPPSPPLPEGIPELEKTKEGQVLYKKQCASCHGVKGDGKGFLAASLEAKPRDFRDGLYKFRSTEAGELPELEDVERTIRAGVPNTTMPAWGQFLGQEKIRSLALYVSTFSERFVKSRREGKDPIKLAVAQPPGALGSLEGEGARLFQKVGCSKCHGSDGKGASQLLSDPVNPVARPADLSYKWAFKNGHKPEDVYRTLTGGLNGVFMPSFRVALPQDRDRWALASFTVSLSPERRLTLRFSDYRSGIIEITKRLDQNGRVRSLSDPKTTRGD